MANFSFRMMQQRPGFNKPVGFVYASLQKEDDSSVLPEQNRKILAETHINAFEKELQKHNPLFKLDEKMKAQIRTAALDPKNTSAAAIIQSLNIAAATTVPLSETDKYLKDNNIAPEVYNEARAKVGAGLSPDQVMAAYRALLAKEGLRSDRDGGTFNGGNMSQGVGNSEFTGNLAGISMANYTTEGSAFHATGMTYGTFNYLRNEARLPDGSHFSAANILHAGQDAKTQKISPNNKPFVKALATLDHYDPKGRDFRNKKGPELADAVAADGKMKEYAAQYEKAKTDEERAKIQAQMHMRSEEIAREKGIAAHIGSLPAPAKPSGEVWKGTHINKGIQKLLPNHPEAQKKLEGQALGTEAGLWTKPENIAAYQAELKKAAGDDPEKAKIAAALIERQNAERALTEKAKADVARAQEAERLKVAAAASQDDAFGPEPTTPKGTLKAEVTEPAPTDKTAVKVATAEPQKTDPAKVEPAKVEPAKTDVTTKKDEKKVVTAEASKTPAPKSPTMA